MARDTKSYRIILDSEVFDEWRKLYPDHGLRQMVLRRVVNAMIKFGRNRNPANFLGDEIERILSKIEGGA